MGKGTALPFFSLSELWANLVDVNERFCLCCLAFFSLVFDFCPTVPALLQLGVADYAEMRQVKLLKDEEQG